MKIGQRHIAPGQVYIIAEIGVNHDGSPARALELVEHAHHAGVDAIKLQHFETDRLMSKSAKLAAYQKAAGETDPIAMLRRLELGISDMAPVVDRAHALGIHAIVSIFSTELVARAETLPWDAYKTASPDLVHKPLLERLTRTPKPLILSTGAATIDEVKQTLAWLPEWGGDVLDRTALLQCVSSYPTSVDMAELGGIRALAGVFGGPIGYSDHTSGVETGADAVACGALLLEKHLTYSRAARGPDHAASLEPDGMRRYVQCARRAADRPAPAPAHPSIKRVLDIEQDVRHASRQSLVALRLLRAGDTISAADLTIKRPGTGIPAAELRSVIGKRAIRAIDEDTLITRGDIQ